MEDDAPGSFQVVASTSELTEGGQLYVELDGEEILICQYQNEYYAISFWCSHAEFPLAGGKIHQGCITCPYHGAEFSIKDGSALTPPAFEAIKTYPIKIIDNTIAVSDMPYAKH